MFPEDLLRPLTLVNIVHSVPYPLVIIYRINQTVGRDDFVCDFRELKYIYYTFEVSKLRITGDVFRQGKF